MDRNYLGFYVRETTKEKGFFHKRTVKENIFGRLRVAANSFAEAQEALCLKMGEKNIVVAIIFPYWEKKENL